MRLFHYTIASLAVFVALIAVDLAWLRYILLANRSLLGFAYDGCDMVVLPMANVLTFGLFRLISRPGEGRRFLIGFEVSGLAALLGFSLCTRIDPDAMNAAFSVAFDPVWNLVFGWVPRGTILQLVVGIFIVSTTYGLPQVLLALGGGLLAQRAVRRRDRGVPDQPSPARGAAVPPHGEDRHERPGQTSLPRYSIGAAIA